MKRLIEQNNFENANNLKVLIKIKLKTFLKIDLIQTFEKLREIYLFSKIQG